MKPIQAWQGIDGKVYPDEDSAEAADEAWRVDRIRGELETFYAANADIGIPMKCIATLRRQVVDIFKKYDEMDSG